MREQTVVVVGAVNMDLGGRPGKALVPRDSNPGRVHASQGGVGRNIAHNLSLLGVNTSLITVLGDDAFAHKITDTCGALGIGLEHSLLVEEANTSTYLFITDERGEMELAVSDMEIYVYITPEFLASRMEALNAATLVVMDTNLPAASVAYLAEHCTAPIFADPVSTTKAMKLKPILGRLHTIKPNLIEAELLTDIKITDEASLALAAQTLLNTGLKRAFISLGDRGVYAAEAGRQIHVPCPPARMVNTTGCGDAFTATLAWAYLEGLDLAVTARAGVSAAAIAMESVETISPKLSTDTVKTRMEAIQ